jgi:hypothetical protein
MSVSFAAKPARLPHDGDITGGRSIGYKPLLRYLHTSGLERLKRWVLSFGSRAEVLSPPSLRDSDGKVRAGTTNTTNNTNRCGGRDVACNVSTTKTAFTIRVLREEVAAELARAAGRYGRGERGDDGPETVYG